MKQAYSFSKVCTALIFTALLSLFSHSSFAGHPAGGNCGHDHVGRTHSTCTGEGASCSVGGVAGTCRQTSSQCNCRTAKAVQQELLINSINDTLGTLIEARKAKARLGLLVLASEVSTLYWVLYDSSLALLELGRLALVDPRMGAVLDSIAARINPAQAVCLEFADVTDDQVRNEFVAVAQLVRSLKKNWIAQQDKVLH